jgi:hypothetical protein
MIRNAVQHSENVRNSLGLNYKSAALPAELRAHFQRSIRRVESHGALRELKTIVAEGVGFEPTVGFPTLDFESSALNRTQPPFLESEKKTSNPPTLRASAWQALNVQHPTSNANVTGEIIK